MRWCIYCIYPIHKCDVEKNSLIESYITQKVDNAFLNTCTSWSMRHLCHQKPFSV